jgi:integrase
MPLRKNRSADNEQALIEAHVLTVGWFVAMDIKTVRPKHILRLVEAMRSAGTLAEKSIATVYSIVHRAFKRALFEDVISDDPCILPPKTIKWKSRNKRTPYTRSEAHALTTSAKVTLATRVWNTLAFYTGMRKGEICGRRWRDWARDARPLSALSVHSQYDDQLLKGDDDDQTRPRLVPVHPALEETLRYWWSEGFELVYCRKPTPDDFIVPSRFGGNLSKSGAYIAFRRALEMTGVKNRTLHATRNTFISITRTKCERADVLEKVTTTRAAPRSTSTPRSSGARSARRSLASTSISTLARPPLSLTRT